MQILQTQNQKYMQIVVRDIRWDKNILSYFQVKDSLTGTHTDKIDKNQGDT